MKNENITMASSIIDLYMDGYDEGKCDDVVIETTTRKHSKKMSSKERVSSRRKKAYYKSKNRMKQLSAKSLTTSAEHENVVQGMLRSHQLPMVATRCELPCGTTIGNKRRADTASQKFDEARLIDIETTCV